MTAPKPRVTIVRHQNNRDFWVITRDLDSRGFQAFLLTRRGVQPAPVVSLAGQAAYPSGFELKAAPNGRRLVCSGTLPLGTTSADHVCVYDFDNATGVVSHEQAVRQLPLNPGQQLGRSASFSPDSQLLYAVEENPNIQTEPLLRFRENDIWQYDLRRDSPAAIAQSRFLVSSVGLPPGPEDCIICFGLQLAPDGTLWASLFYARRFVDQITRMSAAIIRHPNVVGSGCGFEAEGYPYQLGQSPSSTLPNVVTNMLYAPPTLNAAISCTADSAHFWASSAGLANGLRWDFGDPADAANTATGGQVAHRYAHGGTYTVRLTLADGRVLSQPVTIAAAAIDFTEANVFTPNADGLNDEFVPVRTPLAQGHLRIFSRWGQPVADTTGPRLHWNGSGAAAGDYFYQLDYVDCADQPQHRRGVVTLIR